MQPYVLRSRDRTPTNLNIDDNLLNEARRLGNHRTKKETVNTALQEYIMRLKRLAFLKLQGTIDFDPKWDHKAARRKR